MSCDRPAVRADIDTLFVGELSKERWRRVSEHLRSCEECRSYYDRVMLLSQALDGSQPLLDAKQVALVESELLDEVAPRRGRWGRAGWAATALVAAGAAAAMLLPAVFHEPEFRVRGGGGAGAEASLRVVCVAAEVSGSRVRAAFPPVAGHAETPCRQADVMQIAYAIHPGAEERLRYVFVFGLDERLEPLWYFPHPSEGASLAVATSGGESEALLPGGIQLDVNHRPGPLRVLALFSQRPLALTEVEAAVAAKRAEGTSLDSIGAFELGEAEASVLVGVAP